MKYLFSLILSLLVLANGFPQEKPKTTGTVQKGRDMYKGLNSTPGSTDFWDAINDLRANEYYQDIWYKAPLDSLPEEAQKNLEVMLKDLDFLSDKPIDDSSRKNAWEKYQAIGGSEDLQQRYDLGMRYYNAGTEKENHNYLKEAMNHFSWIAETFGTQPSADFRNELYNLITDMVTKEYNNNPYYRQVYVVKGLKALVYLFPNRSHPRQDLKFFGIPAPVPQPSEKEYRIIEGWDQK